VISRRVLAVFPELNIPQNPQPPGIDTRTGWNPSLQKETIPDGLLEGGRIPVSLTTIGQM
jgi:hypothetical protein